MLKAEEKEMRSYDNLAECRYMVRFSRPSAPVNFFYNCFILCMKPIIPTWILFFHYFLPDNKWEEIFIAGLVEGGGIHQKPRRF